MKYELLSTDEQLRTIEAELLNVEREHYTLTVAAPVGNALDDRVEVLEKRHEALSEHRKELKTKVDKASKDGKATGPV